MRKMTEIPPTQDHRPIELRHLRVAAYCQVSTELEEQSWRSRPAVSNCRCGTIHS